MNLKLSVLDQTPIRRGSNAVESLQESIQLARMVNELGYERYWLSEHHNISTLAGGSPEVFIARLGAETSRIRLGSGGIMLPNHSALRVAENFRLLEALYPQRIDLGIGRAPGGDRLTASMLNPSNTFDPKDYVQQIRDLKAFLSDEATEGTVYEKVKAIPRISTMPQLWMLTSSGESAYLAAHFGMPVSFAHFINPVGGIQAVDTYRDMFKPSQELTSPKVSVGIFAFCGETEAAAMRVQAVMDYRLLSIEKGKLDETPSYDLVRNVYYTPEEMSRIRFNRQRMIVGTKEEVSQRFEQFAKEYKTEELVIATFADTAEERLHSYKLLADTFLAR